jgi:hypothetical protein
MEKLNEINERELRKAYEIIPNMKSKSFEEFAEMVAYWCKRCHKKRQ